MKSRLEELKEKILILLKNDYQLSEGKFLNYLKSIENQTIPNFKSIYLSYISNIVSSVDFDYDKLKLNDFFLKFLDYKNVFKNVSKRKIKQKLNMIFEWDDDNPIDETYLKKMNTTDLTVDFNKKNEQFHSFLIKTNNFFSNSEIDYFSNAYKIKLATFFSFIKDEKNTLVSIRLIMALLYYVAVETAKNKKLIELVEHYREWRNQEVNKGWLSHFNEDLLNLNKWSEENSFNFFTNKFYKFKYLKKK